MCACSSSSTPTKADSTSNKDTGELQSTPTKNEVCQKIDSDLGKAEANLKKAVYDLDQATTDLEQAGADLSKATKAFTDSSQAGATPKAIADNLQTRYQVISANGKIQKDLKEATAYFEQYCK